MGKPTVFFFRKKPGLQKSSPSTLIQPSKLNTKEPREKFWRCKFMRIQLCAASTFNRAPTFILYNLRCVYSRTGNVKIKNLEIARHTRNKLRVYSRISMQRAPWIIKPRVCISAKWLTLILAPELTSRYVTTFITTALEEREREPQSLEP